MKIRRMSGTLFRVDRRTDEQTNMTTLIVAFRKFEMAPQNNYDFLTYRRKYLNIFTLPSLNWVSLHWKGTSYTAAVHTVCLCNWIINWDHVTVIGWRVVKGCVIKRGSNAHAATSVLWDFQKHLPWLKIFLQLSRSHTNRPTPRWTTLTSY